MAQRIGDKSYSFWWWGDDDCLLLRPSKKEILPCNLCLFVFYLIKLIILIIIEIRFNLLFDYMLNKGPMAD